MGGQAAGEHSLTYRGPLAADEAGELAVTHALLRQALQGRLDRAVRIYSPLAPVVVFGRSDMRLPGFRAAVQSAQRAGFDTAVRAVGGRVVAYSQDSVVLDVVRHEPQAVQAIDRRFAVYGHVIATALQRLGVDARVGAVPGEYCPGAYSVNARGSVKLVGTAQRVVKDAWLFSSLVIVDDQARLQEVLTEVHSRLDLPFGASSVGSVRSEAPAVTLTDVVAALSQACGLGDTPAVLDAGTRELAVSLQPNHRIVPDVTQPHVVAVGPRIST